MDSKEPKLDFGPEKPKKMLSWEGAFYIIWNWKTYAFYILWIFCSFMAFGWFSLSSHDSPSVLLRQTTTPV